jgi:hypothetical protein
MKYITFFLLLLMGISLNAQNKPPHPNKAQVNCFMNSTTRVIDDNSMLGFNAFLHKAVQDSWKLTKYSFLSSQQFDSLKKDTLQSFIFLTKVQLENDESETMYHFLNVALGDTSPDLTLMPEFISVPVSTDQADQDEYLFKVDLFVRFIQNHIQLMNLMPSLYPLQRLTYYNKSTKELKSRTLLIDKADIAQNVDTALLRKEYRFNLRVVDRAVIETAVKEKQSNTAILHHVGPGSEAIVGRTYFLILGTDDAKLYYYDFRNVNVKNRDGLNVRDIGGIR